MFKALSILLLLLLPAAAMAVEVQLGDSEEQVTALLGTPASKFTKGLVTILSFPRGTVRLANGSVTAIDLETEEVFLKRQAVEVARREKAALEQAERTRLLQEEGRKVCAERMASAAFLALPAGQRLAFWRQFCSRYPGVAPGLDMEVAQIQARDDAKARADELARQKSIRDMQAQVADAEQKTQEAEWALERTRRAMYYQNYYPAYYPNYYQRTPCPVRPPHIYLPPVIRTVPGGRVTIQMGPPLEDNIHLNGGGVRIITPVTP